MPVRAWARGVVRAAIGALGAATVFGFFDRFAWQLELATVFRVQYAALLTLLGALALLLRFRVWAVAAAALAALNVALVTRPLGAAPTETVGGVPVRLLIVNVEVGNDRYEDLARLVAETEADVVGVTELDEGWAEQLERRLPAYRQRLAVPFRGAYGVGIFSRVPLEPRVERFPADDGPPTIVARVAPRGAAPLTLVVTHVHTLLAGTIHARHLRALADARPRLGERVAVCGDFNTVPWAAAFREFADGGLIDVHGGSLLAYTWPTWNPLLRLPLDNCLVDGVAVRDHWRGPDIGSDHYPLIVELDVPRSA